MRSNATTMNKNASGFATGDVRFRIRHALFAISYLLLAILVFSGCAQIPNQWVDDSPATKMNWETPTTEVIEAKYAPAGQLHLNWAAAQIAPASGVVTHWPLYFENPFVFKGAGRTGFDKYRLGWEDFVAVFYNYPGLTLDFLALPVSLVATPPWMLMESDGQPSRQTFGYDYDATRAVTR